MSVCVEASENHGRAAVDHGHMVQYLDDLLTAEGSVRLVERPVGPDEIGKTPADLKPDIVLRLYRKSGMFSFSEMDRAGSLQAGDVMVLMTGGHDHGQNNRKNEQHGEAHHATKS